MFDPKMPFELPKLPPDITYESHPNLDGFIKLLTNAQKNLSELAGVLTSIENPEILLNTLYLKESVSSNAVENIHTTIESALEDDTKPENERSEANKEVIKYREALLAGFESINKYGLSTRTIKAIHKNLNVTKGIPGEFRKQQNSIANTKADGTKEIIYTPPIFKDVDRLIGNLEKFTHENNDFVSLIKTAISHYQFEAIHPFEDGNGRTGRIFMVLQLVQDDLIGYPILFISGYLSENEKEYKRLLLKVTKEKSWWEFIFFMVKGIAMQALVTRIALLNLKVARLEIIIHLNDIPKKVIKRANIESTVNHIFANPTTQSKFMEEETGIHWQTCTKYLNYLVDLNILSVEKKGRYKFYSNKLSVEALAKSTAKRKSKLATKK
jgi:Fic family protein